MNRGWLALPWLLGAATATAADAGFECLLEPSQVVEIRSSVEGVIASIAVHRGDTVRQGQPLMELKSAAERAAVESARYRSQMEGQIASARNRIDYATKKLERMTELQRDNLVSAQARDEADAEKRLAEAELLTAVEGREMAKIDYVRAQEQLALRSIASPFNGVVVDRLLNPGDLAEAGTGRKPALKVAQIDPMRADVALPASLFGQVKVGSRAWVSPVIGKARLTATVRGIDRVIDAASGTFVARLEVPNPGSQVPGGARCTATIDGVSAPPRARP